MKDFYVALVWDMDFNGFQEITTYEYDGIDEEHERYYDIWLFGFGEYTLNSCIHQKLGTGFEEEFITYKKEDNKRWIYRPPTSVLELINEGNLSKNEILNLTPFNNIKKIIDIENGAKDHIINFKDICEHGISKEKEYDIAKGLKKELKEE